MSTICPVLTALLIAGPAVAQIPNAPFPDPIPASEGVIVVGLEEFAVLPNIDGAPARPMVLVDEPGSGRLFVNDMWGLLYAISYDGSVTRYLDTREPRWEVEVETPEVAPIMEVGLQSFAFHPHFNEPGTAGYGKLYTWIDTNDTAPEPDFVPGGGGYSCSTSGMGWYGRSCGRIVRQVAGRR